MFHIGAIARPRGARSAGNPKEIDAVPWPRSILGSGALGRHRAVPSASLIPAMPGVDGTEVLVSQGNRLPGTRSGCRCFLRKSCPRTSNTLMIIPLIVGIRAARHVGLWLHCRARGAMRISKEVDLTSRRRRSIRRPSWLRSALSRADRDHPAYRVGLLTSNRDWLIVTQFFGQSPGTVLTMYFERVRPLGDVLGSFGKVLPFAVVVILIHCDHLTWRPPAVVRWRWRPPWSAPCGRSLIVAINVIDLSLFMAISGFLEPCQVGGPQP